MRYLILLLFFIPMTACVEGDIDATPFMEARYQERVAGQRGNILKQCREDVMEVAIARADSLLLDRARKIRRIAGRPPKPNRPGAPPVKELSAPLPLRPLFPSEIRFDTLLRDSLYRDSLYLDSLLRIQ